MGRLVDVFGALRGGGCACGFARCGSRGSFVAVGYGVYFSFFGREVFGRVRNGNYPGYKGGGECSARRIVLRFRGVRNYTFGCSGMVCGGTGAGMLVGYGGYGARFLGAPSGRGRNRNYGGYALVCGSFGGGS